MRLSDYICTTEWGEMSDLVVEAKGQSHAVSLVMMHGLAFAQSAIKSFLLVFQFDNPALEYAEV